MISDNFRTSMNVLHICHGARIFQEVQKWHHCSWFLRENMHNSLQLGQLILFSYYTLILKYTTAKISGIDTELRPGDQFCISDWLCNNDWVLTVRGRDIPAKLCISNQKYDLWRVWNGIVGRHKACTQSRELNMSAKLKVDSQISGLFFFFWIGDLCLSVWWRVDSCGSTDFRVMVLFGSELRWRSRSRSPEVD